MKLPDISDLAPQAKQLWSAWNIRAFVLLSFLVQCFLVSCASEKKRTRKSWLVTLISIAYYLADWIGPFTIGLIMERRVIICLIFSDQEGSNIAGDPDPGEDEIRVYYELLIFWISFLPLHLGGPDNLTTLSVEDNKTSGRKIQSLFAHVYLTFSFYQSRDNDALFLASLLVFVAGVIKTAERVGSMILATLDDLNISASDLSPFWQRVYESLVKTKRCDYIPLVPPEVYGKLVDTQLAMAEASLPTRVEILKIPPKRFRHHRPLIEPLPRLEFDANGPLDEKSLLEFGCFFYNNFIGLFIDQAYNDEQREFTRDFFRRRNSHDAFKIAEIELNFLHEDIHTKAAGFPAMRILTLALITAASPSFLSIDKRGWSGTDKGISYVMLFGTIVLEIVSLLMFIFSGRRVNVTRQFNLLKPIAKAIVHMPMWSESLSKCNLICYCLHYRCPLQIKYTPEVTLIWLKTKVTTLLMKYTPEVMLIWLKTKVTTDTISKSWKDMIFKELCTRSKLADNLETATKICSQRGDWALMRSSCYSKLKWSLGEVEYGHSILLWHIATDLLCSDTNDCDEDTLCSEKRSICQGISGYLLYLLLEKPTMIAPIASNWEQIFGDTSLEIERFFDKRSITGHKQACREILSVDTSFEPIILKGDASASVLFDACRLAKQLSDISQDKRWSLMSGVWIELLTYAAFHCEGTVHVQSPSQGGELLTFVWLLMNHLGLGKQFCEEPDQTRYQQAVGK